MIYHDDYFYFLYGNRGFPYNVWFSLDVQFSLEPYTIFPRSYVRIVRRLVRTGSSRSGMRTENGLKIKMRVVSSRWWSAPFQQAGWRFFCIGGCPFFVAATWNRTCWRRQLATLCDCHVSRKPATLSHSDAYKRGLRTPTVTQDCTKCKQLRTGRATECAAARKYTCTLCFAASMADGDCAKDADGASLKDQEVPEVTGRQPKIRRIRNFEEVNRWSHDDHTLEEIDAFIRSTIWF